VLVSGIIEGTHSTEYVHSIGEIIATTKKTYTYSQDFIQEKNQYGENIKNRKVINFFGLNIPLFLGEVGENYIGGEVKKETMLKNVPIVIYKRDFTPFIKVKKKYKEDYLIRQSEQMLKMKIEAQGIKKYKIEKTNVERTKKGVKVKFSVKMQENIAYQDVLLYNNKDK